MAFYSPHHIPSAAILYTIYVVYVELRSTTVVMTLVNFGCHTNIVHNASFAVVLLLSSHGVLYRSAFSRF